MTSFTRRVTHLASGDLWGGAEAFVHALATEQHRARPGSVSCVIMNPGQLASELIRSGIPTVVLDESRSGFRELLHAVKQHVESFMPHVLHAHRQKENLLALFAGWGQRPEGRALCRVTTVHGLPEPIRARNFFRTGIKNVLNSAALRLGFDAIVGVSRDIATRLQSHYPADRVACIHNGVAIRAQSAAPRAQQRRALRLLALGRLVPIKRFDRLKTLSDEIAKSQLSRPRITLAGDGPLRDELRELLRADAPESLVQMPGFVVDTAPLLRDTDALVMTSDHEGIPMAVLEALAAGVPVFGFAVGGLPEIAAPGLPLRLTAHDDVPALAREIVSYFTNHELGSRAPSPNDWSFDIRCCARGYEELYQQLSLAS